MLNPSGTHIPHPHKPQRLWATTTTEWEAITIHHNVAFANTLAKFRFIFFIWPQNAITISEAGWNDVAAIQEVFGSALSGEFCFSISIPIQRPFSTGFSIRFATHKTTLTKKRKDVLSWRQSFRSLLWFVRQEHSKKYEKWKKKLLKKNSLRI